MAKNVSKPALSCDSILAKETNLLTRIHVLGLVVEPHHPGKLQLLKVFI